MASAGGMLWPMSSEDPGRSLPHVTDLAHVRKFCDLFQVRPPPPSARFHLIHLGPGLTRDEDAQSQLSHHCHGRALRNIPCLLRLAHARRLVLADPFGTHALPWRGVSCHTGPRGVGQVLQNGTRAMPSWGLKLSGYGRAAFGDYQGELIARDDKHVHCTSQR